MPPRGNEGYDFTPILTHYLFLFTSILAVVCALLALGDERQRNFWLTSVVSQAGWFTAFIGQAVATADSMCYKTSIGVYFE